MTTNNSQESGCAEKVAALWDSYVEEHDHLTHDFVCKYLSCGDNLAKARRLSDKYGAKASKLLTGYLDEIAEAFGGKQEAKSMHETFFKLLDSLSQQIDGNI